MSELRERIQARLETQLAKATDDELRVLAIALGIEETPGVSQSGFGDSVTISVHKETENE